MSPVHQIGRSLAGAVALARFDRKGMEYFDFSYDGFWRSFQAILLSVPVMFAAALVYPEVSRQLAELQPDLSAPARQMPQNIVLFSVVGTVSFIAGWLFFPVAMIWIARLLRIGDRYVPLIVTWNWHRAVATYALLVPVVLCGLGVLGAGFLIFLQFLFFFYVLAYRWFVIRNAAGVAAGTTFGLVLFDLLGAFLVDMMIGQVYWLFDSGPPPAPGNV